ncbi:MAG: hypothetical protein AABZ39_08220 [Spirochaetota bacterium]
MSRFVTVLAMALSSLAVLPLTAQTVPPAEKADYFWQWAKADPLLAKELAEVYKSQASWRDEIKGDDAKDALKMKWILENSAKHPKLAEAAFEWADKHPLKTEWLWKHPKAADWVCENRADRVEFLKNHPGLAHRMKDNVKVAAFLKTRPEIRDRAEDVRDKREDVRDKKEDVRDKREDVRDAKHDGGKLDKAEDVRDKREDVRDRKEDVRDRRENVRDRRR